MTVSSSFPQGGYNVTSQAPPNLASPRSFDRYLAAMGEWQRRRFLMGQRQPQPMGRPVLGGAGAAPATPRPVAQERPVESALDRQLAQERSLAEIDKIHAARDGPPLKLVTIAGQTFYVPDDLAMNYNQRQMYLPQTAGIQDPRLEALAGAVKSETAQGEWDDYLAGVADPYEQARAQNVGGGQKKTTSGGLTPASTALPIGQRT